MDPVCRPGTAVFGSVVLGVSIALAARSAARLAPGASAQETGSALIGARVRAWYRGSLAPVEAWLASVGCSPDALTYAQLAVSALAGWAFAVGGVFLGGSLVLTAGTFDILDGGLARRRGVSGPRGALIDSVADRWAEFVTFLGLGVLYREGWMLLVVALAAFASQMVSYVRARAEGLGIGMATGRAQRPERYVLLGFGAIVSGLAGHLACPAGRPSHAVLTVCLLLLAALSTWTAVERAWVAAGRITREGS